MRITISDFAKIAKVSRQTISKQCKKGNLARNPNGSIDTTHIINAEYLRKKSEEGQTVKTPSSDEQVHEAVIKSIPKNTKDKITVKKANTIKKKPGKIQKPKNQEEVEDYIPSDLSRPLTDLSKYDLDRLKIIEGIEKTRLETSIKRSNFIDINSARSVFSKIYEIHMNEFLTIKDKLTPDIASIFGVSDQEKTFEAGDKIDKMLWKVLDHVKLEINKFLIKVKTDGIE